MKFNMTEGDIRVSYRDAAHKRRQIEILAQLNGCYVEEICKVLGLPYDRADDIITEEKNKQYQDLYDSGLNDLQIATAVGVCRQTITLWRISKDLPACRPNMARNGKTNLQK